MHRPSPARARWLRPSRTPCGCVPSSSPRRIESTRPSPDVTEVTGMRAVAPGGMALDRGGAPRLATIGLVHGPAWPTISDFFRSFMAVALGRFMLFGLLAVARLAPVHP